MTTTVNIMTQDFAPKDAPPFEIVLSHDGESGLWGGKVVVEGVVYVGAGRTGEEAGEAAKALALEALAAMVALGLPLPPAIDGVFSLTTDPAQVTEGATEEKRTITLELDEETLRYLAVLGPPGKVGDAADGALDALYHLAHSAADGMRRPGSWERGWLHQAFGSDFEDRLVPDPDCGWHEIPNEERGWYVELVEWYPEDDGHAEPPGTCVLELRDDGSTVLRASTPAASPYLETRWHIHLLHGSFADDAIQALERACFEERPDGSGATTTVVLGDPANGRDPLGPFATAEAAIAAAEAERDASERADLQELLLETLRARVVSVAGGWFRARGLDALRLCHAKSLEEAAARLGLTVEELCPLSFLTEDEARENYAAERRFWRLDDEEASS